MKGSSTLEILIAFAILTLSLTALISVVFGNRSVTLDTEANTDALYAAQQALEYQRAVAASDYLAASSTDGITTINNFDYPTTVTVEDLTPCKKQVTSSIDWSNSPLRPQKVELSTFLTDIIGALMLGGDCFLEASDKLWDNPQRFASDKLDPGKTTSIDVLDRIAYLGMDKAPYLAIADTADASLGQTDGLFVEFDNGFNNNGKVLSEIRDIDVFEVDGGLYALVATASSTAPFAIIDVTDINNPVLVAKRSLNGVNPAGSQPFGYRVYYYDLHAYIVTRETDGPELHIFDVSDPSNPTELGSEELNTTTNDFLVRDGIAYFADESDARGELLAYDVSDPSAVDEIAGARTNLSGDENGASLALIGNKLYFGRETVAGGPELYVFDVSDTPTVSGGLPSLGTPQEIGSDVLSIAIAGKFAFLATSKTKEEFQVWRVSNASVFTLVKRYNFGNIVAGGLDYEPDFVYTTGNASPNFQILYSST